MRKWVDLVLQRDKDVNNSPPSMFKLKLKNLTKSRRGSTGRRRSESSEEKEREREKKKLTISGPINLEDSRDHENR